MISWLRLMGWPILITASAVGLLIVSDTSSALRVALTFWFLFLCPGMAFIRLLQLDSRITEWSLAVALSVAISTLITETTILAGYWSTWTNLMIVMSLTMIGVVLQIIQLYHLQSNGNQPATSTMLISRD